MNKEYFDNKNLEDKLNDTSSISHFEVTNNFFLIHMKNGDTIEVSATNQDSPLSVVCYKYE